MVAMLQEVPPLVRFEYLECGVDHEASERTGRRIPIVKAHAIITQRGSRDETIKNADEWLAQLKDKVMQGTYNQAWWERFKLMYAEFQKGNELPPDGTPIKTWGGINREQQIRLTAIGIQTLEELAAQPDSSLGTIGLDGRFLRDLARNTIQAGTSTGVLAKKLADLEQAGRDKDDTIKRLEDRLSLLEAVKQETLKLPKKAA